MTSESFTRTFTRIPVHIDATVRPEKGDAIQGRVHDLSMGGVSVETSATLPTGSRCTIDLVLRAGGPALDIFLTGRVVRAHDGLLAFSVESIDPAGYEHLTNLLLYNAPDARSFEEELEARADDQPPVAPTS